MSGGMSYRLEELGEHETNPCTRLNRPRARYRSAASLSRRAKRRRGGGKSESERGEPGEGKRRRKREFVRYLGMRAYRGITRPASQSDNRRRSTDHCSPPGPAWARSLLCSHSFVRSFGPAGWPPLLRRSLARPILKPVSRIATVLKYCSPWVALWASAI